MAKSTGPSEITFGVAGGEQFVNRPVGFYNALWMPKLDADAKETRRRALVDAARRCAARGGYRNLSVDDVCGEAEVSKGAFYTYFDHKDDLLLALTADDAAELDGLLAKASHSGSGVSQIRQFVAALVGRGSDAATVQLKADLWAEMTSNSRVRARMLDATRQRRQRLAELIEVAVAEGELIDVPANALAAVLLALSDGLMLHRDLDPSGFRWPNVRRAVDRLLEGLRADGKS